MWAWLACGTPGLTPAGVDGVQAVPWTPSLPMSSEFGTHRGLTPFRTIVHLHSPWSHDACDGVPLIDGQPDPACVDDLRAALCTTRVDVAFLTDHPEHAAFQSYGALFHEQPGDVVEDGANRITCEDGHSVRLKPGIEDELMPIGLDRHVSEDSAVNDAVYNSGEPSAIADEIDAGAVVLLAHTEQRDRATLEAQQDAGLTGVELFNLHAMFDPDIREEAFGLDGLGWVTDIAPFTDPEQTTEPDLLVLGVLAEQTPSLAHLDALAARGHIVGVAGTDAHQNVLPILLKDGERGDSYRRMLRWFSNVVFAETADGVEAALAAGQVAVAFEILGTPVGIDFTLDSPEGVVEMGGEGGEGLLWVGCPTVSSSSPSDGNVPEILTTVFRDGVAWREGCGVWETEGPAVYRVRHDIVPEHLRVFLGEDPDPWIHPWPWVYTNPIWVR